MMGRWLAPVIVLIPFCAADPAVAGERGPVCRQPSVVDEMTRQVRDHDYYTHRDPNRIQSRFRRCLANGFEIQILPHGFVVRDLR
jgi:hypothetical protein